MADTKLQEFQSLRPDITIKLEHQDQRLLVFDSHFHAAIRSGKAPWPGTIGDYLIPEDHIPVCSPAL